MLSFKLYLPTSMLVRANFCVRLHEFITRKYVTSSTPKCLSPTAESSGRQSPLFYLDVGQISPISLACQAVEAEIDE